MLAKVRGMAAPAHVDMREETRILAGEPAASKNG
jgi:hypothetical protein